jgi:hypothetical protein
VLATLVRGVNRPSLGDARERLPTSCLVGMSYRAARSVEIALEWEHDVLYEPGVTAGIEFVPADPFCLRVGMIGASKSWTVGFGLRYRGVICDYGLMRHPILGPMHTLSLGFDPG